MVVVVVVVVFPQGVVWFVVALTGSRKFTPRVSLRKQRHTLSQVIRMV